MKKNAQEQLEELLKVGKKAVETLEKATAIINDLRKENKELKDLLKKVKETSNEEKVKTLIK